jgi:galactosamine-6-phosphate isomerase
MKIHYCTDYWEMSVLGAELVHREIEITPNLLFCAASGNSPSGLYACMEAKYQDSPDFFTKMRVIKLDEWVGLPADSTFTSEYDVQEKLLKKLNIEEDRYVSFDAQTSNPQAECDRIQDELDEIGPIDVCVLGVGINGHLALNEPADFKPTNISPHDSEQWDDRKSRSSAIARNDNGNGEYFRIQENYCFLHRKGKKTYFRKVSY